MTRKQSKCVECPDYGCELYPILLLAMCNNRYTNIDLRKDPDGPAIRAELGALVGRTSVPAIWIQQQYIGGCNDGGPNNGGIVALQNSNQLDAMLQGAGAL